MLIKFVAPAGRVSHALLSRRAVGVAVVVIALVSSSAALAGGGSTIKTAPTVRFGVDTIGNTSSVPALDACGGTSNTEWWLVPLITGDHLVVKYENSAPNIGVGGTELFPVRTDDFNLGQAQAVAGARMNDNNHDELDYDAKATGIYPLGFFQTHCYADATPGAYDFTATVQHTAWLIVAHTPVARVGAVLVQARFPDGSPIRTGLGATLYGNWAHKWQKLGKAAVSNGAIRIHFSLPMSVKGHLIELRVAAGGPSFKGRTLTWRTAVH